MTVKHCLMGPYDSQYDHDFIAVMAAYSKPTQNLAYQESIMG